MSEAQRDEVVPRGAWQFDQEVTAVFDDMLQRSIPQYNAMRMVTFEVGRRFVQPGTAIIDMGCSRGQALLPFVSNFGAANDYIGLEISEPMIEAARQNFNYHPHGNRVTIQSADLRHEFHWTSHVGEQSVQKTQDWKPLALGGVAKRFNRNLS